MNEWMDGWMDERLQLFSPQKKKEKNDYSFCSDLRASKDDGLHVLPHPI
jgi:hypothetical protein